MTREELNVWLMRTALEKILHSRCVCDDPIQDATRIACCPVCLAKSTLEQIDGHKVHKTPEFKSIEFIGT